MRIATVALALVCATAGRGAAQSAAEAEALFRQGKQLMATGNLPEACAAFEASQKAEPAVSTLLNLANCREKNGQLATAWGLFLDAERQTRSAADAGGKQMHATAADRAAKLEHRLPYLTISVAAHDHIDGLEIRRDGTVVDTITWGRALPVDGGSHTIEARAPGRKTWTKTITVLAHDDSQSVIVPELEAAPASTATQAQEPPPPHEEPARAATHRGRGLAPWLVSATALALGGTALGFELSARSTYDSAVREPDPMRQNSLYNSANTRRYAADGLAAGAIVCTGVAVWLFVRGGGDSRTSVQVAIDPTHVGAVWTGAW